MIVAGRRGFIHSKGISLADYGIPRDEWNLPGRPKSMPGLLAFPIMMLKVGGETHASASFCLRYVLAHSGEAALTGVEFAAMWVIVAYIAPLIWAGRLIERRHKLENCEFSEQ
jgi:hypothetical protein